jgi:hypothetical protein
LIHPSGSTLLERALRRKPLNVVDANKALKEAVSKIVLDPEEGELIIHWHHASEPTRDCPLRLKALCVG